MATKGNKTKKIEATEVKTALDTAKGLELGKVVSDIGTLQVSIQNTLSNVSTTLANKIQQLEQVDAAISAKQTQLKELFGIENEAISLDDMKAQKEEEQKVWNQERVARMKLWDEEKSEHDKQWKREKEEYEYHTAQRHKRVAEEFESLVNRNKRLETVRQEVLNKNWEERENSLKAREQEFTDLKAQVNNFDARIKTEVSKAEAILGNTLKKQYEHEMALLKKDSEAEKVLHAARVISLEGNVKSLQDAISKLELQLSAVRNDAREVATQALQSASGRQVADALQQMVTTQNAVPTKTK